MSLCLQNLVRYADTGLARVSLALRRERPGLRCFMFHTLFRDRSDMALNHIDPLQETTVEQFREFIAYYLRHGYKFVRARDLLEGLDPSGRDAMITFDDGYFNNFLALPILDEFNVPATFFISSEHVKAHKCFWWDVVYRQRIAEGWPAHRADDVALTMKDVTTEEMEADLIHQYGAQAMAPRSDIDRPMTPSELREISGHPLVEIGNHSMNHAILTNYPPDEARRQIVGAQEDLREMTGQTPVAIAYPNGNFDDSIVELCRAAGLSVGVTIRPGKNRLPLSAQRLMRLSRFCIHEDAPFMSQCRTYRADLLLYGSIRALYLRLAGGKTASR